MIAILVGTGALDTGEDGSNLQNLLICLEMLPASIAMFYAFPYTEYTEGGENLKQLGVHASPPGAKGGVTECYCLGCWGRSLEGCWGLFF